MSENSARLAAQLRAQALRNLRRDAPTSTPSGQPVHEPVLFVDTLLILPSLGSGALRKIAEYCEKIIAGRMSDGVFD
jgi:hypothetical protein